MWRSLVLMILLSASIQSVAQRSILVFSKTAGFRHESIPAGQQALFKMGEENNWKVDTTEDSRLFNKKNLKQYDCIVFLNTTLDVFDSEQEEAFKNYIEKGGGYVGVHAASDTEFDWPWYNQLVGAYFDGHPKQQKASIIIKDSTHLSSQHLPSTWEHFDEWYNFKSIQPHINVICQVDESSYKGGTNGDFHPIAWHHKIKKGKVFYTALGHTKECYSDPLFLRHLEGGIKSVME